MLNNLQHDDRPWGYFDRFTLNEISTVKILHINHGGELSYQFHNHRSEFWRIISGHPIVTIDDVETVHGPGDNIEIPQGAKHAISALTDDVEFLEIALGEFDELDITRLKDKYGRS